ncbi:hypothetical protein LOTGIDRAFT_230267 [Lottia gigantea]|uniref:Uncharacterized protein n=1 Tax=Lottia gigantea TaxID=225164 RepID=V4AIQ7_LOTGI|nr:hypothetical protein LOTGIDRAFT_230267 [Lottia gigantea]ESP03994.1 hypothetical protein LOTGIDRAFT_230267 [Lottia gigantea]
MSSARSNLSALAEDDDEEEEEEPEVLSSEESENEGENGPLKEPNKFDVLCDGVVNSMAIVQTAIQELLGLKDEILQHTLPPAVLIKFATVCGRVFRSVSDQSKPVNELVRMVQVYSTPWEEKSAALKKLHDDYENKQRQLNIAIKRLQLVDAHSKRIAREKRIMNWEKLFAKVTSTKGHGRRWKFLIETIKQKAKMGYEHVQEYTRSLEESTDSESEEEEDTLVAQQSVLDVTSAGPTTSVTPSEKPDSNDDDDDDSSDKEPDTQGGSILSGTTPIGDILNATVGDIDEEDALESVESMEDIESGHVSPKKVRFGQGEVTFVKPEVKDNSTWTDETEYKEYLYVRVFKPIGLGQHEIKCSLTYGNQMFKTGVLDLKQQEEEEGPKSPTRPPAAGRHHGRTSRSPLVEEPPPKNHGRYEEFMLNIDTPTNVPGEKLKPLQFAIQHGQFEEIVAMAAVEVSDLKQLDLKTVYLPPVKGDDDVLKQDDDLDSINSLSESIDIPLNDTDSEKSLVIKNEALKYVDPIPFPLFPLKTGRSSIATPGSLPLIFYWGKRPQPKTFNRQIGTMGVKELVYDLTGIDLHTTTKEDLNKEMRDDACSAILFTPEPTEETVLKSEFEALQNKHENEIQVLQTKYETRLQELMDNLNSMVEQQKQQQQKAKSPKATPRQVSNISRSTDSAKSNRSVKIQPAAPPSPSPVKSSSPIEVVFDPGAPPPVKSLPTPPKHRTRYGIHTYFCTRNIGEVYEKPT